MRTAETIEQNKLAAGETQNSSPSVKRRRMPPQTRAAIAPYQFKPGQSGNPGGRPKDDVAKRIAQAVFSNNEEAIYAAFAESMLKGNAYVFKEIAERAFGKLAEKVDVNMSGDVIERLAAARKRLKK